MDDISQGICLALPHLQVAENMFQIFQVGNGRPVQVAVFIAALENSMGNNTKKYCRRR